MKSMPRREITPEIYRLMLPADRDYAIKKGLYVDLSRDPAEVEKNQRKLERIEQKEFLNWARQNSEKVYVINPQSNTPSTIKVGHPDFSIYIDGGITIFIEMKTEEGKLSAEQEERISELRNLGFRAIVCRSALEAVLEVKKYLK